MQGNVPHVARNVWLSVNVYSQITIFNEYKLLKTVEPHVVSNVRYIAFPLGTNTTLL